MQRLPKGTKNHHCTTRVMVEASSHLPLYSLVESTQRVYVVRIFFVFARTNKRHHHHLAGEDSAPHSEQIFFVGGGVCRVGLGPRGGRRRRRVPGHGPTQAVCRGDAVLRLCMHWPPSPCRTAAPCGLCLVAGGGGWCCCRSEAHATLSVAACNRGKPSSVSSSTSGLSLPSLP